MKLSIIIPVLNSHEIVRRQLLHFEKMNLPDDTELIIVDDGSDPPLDTETTLNNFTLLYTHDTRNWTQPAARNFGIEQAKGECLICTDIDHVIDEKAVEFGRRFKYGYGRFKRELGVLDEFGNLTQEPSELMKFGLPYEKANSSLRISCHTLSMYVRADVLKKTGGFREKFGSHPTHDDGNMKSRLNHINTTKCPDDERPTIYMIPNGRYCGDKDYNPLGLFHSLERMTR